SGHKSRPVSKSSLVHQQTFENSDRGVKRRADRSVLRLAVPSAVLELLADQPRHHIAHILIEVCPQDGDHAVDARLHFPTEQRLTGVLPSAVLTDPRDGTTH